MSCCYVDSEMKECEGATLSSTKIHEIYGSVNAMPAIKICHGPGLGAHAGAGHSTCHSWSLPESRRAQARHWAHSSCFRATQHRKNDEHILSRWDTGLTADAPSRYWRSPAHYQVKEGDASMLGECSCIWCVPGWNWHDLYADLIPKDNKTLSCIKTGHLTLKHFIPCSQHGNCLFFPGAAFSRALQLPIKKMGFSQGNKRPGQGRTSSFGIFMFSVLE